MASSVLNFDDVKVRSRFISRARELRGRWRIDAVRYRPRRSDRQNAWYWPCFVEPYAAKLSEEACEVVTALQAHEDLKRRYLSKQIICKKTGVLLAEVVGSSAALNTSDFNEYLDKCAAFLATEHDIEIPEPSQYHEREETTKGMVTNGNS